MGTLGSSRSAPVRIINSPGSPTARGAAGGPGRRRRAARLHYGRRGLADGRARERREARTADARGPARARSAATARCEPGASAAAAARGHVREEEIGARPISGDASVCAARAVDVPRARAARAGKFMTHHPSPAFPPILAAELVDGRHEPRRPARRPGRAEFVSVISLGEADAAALRFRPRRRLVLSYAAVPL